MAKEEHSEHDRDEAEATAEGGDASRFQANRPRNVAVSVAPPPAAALGKSVTIFLAVMVGLASGFWLLGAFDSPFAPPAPKWKEGDVVDVELTLDPLDDTKLACASDVEMKGKWCEYETKTTRSTKKLDDATMLRPYNTVASMHLLAAGVWSAPELEKAKRPRDRFTVKCKFSVEGKIASPAVRWDVGQSWNEKDEEWYAGAVSGCTIQK